MPTAIPLPAFRQPPGPDDPLPTVPADQQTTSSSDEPTASQPDSHPSSPPDDDRPAPLPPSPAIAAAARTRTSSPAGDSKVAAKFVRGLIAILTGTAAALLARNGRHLRQPTAEQIGDVADPLGAILARHLPTELLSDDLVDITSAAAGAHAYVLDGPLVERIPTATISYPEESP